MTLTDRQERERRYWNEHAQVREYSEWQEFPYEEWRVYRPIETMALDHLGTMTGKRLLVAGVGSSAILFAQAGAEVWGFDISEVQIAAVQALVDRYDLADRIHLKAMPFENLDYPDSFFDVAFGDAILHHIDLSRGAAELKRVLRPGGKASFIEPLGTNPLLQVARRYLPYRNKGRTEDERPLQYRDIRTFTRPFPKAEYRESALLSMLGERVITSRATIRRLQALDETILRRAAWMRPLCQMVWIGVETA